MKYIQQTAVAVIGGDSRQIMVADALADLGAKVSIYGHPPDRLSEKVHSHAELSEACRNVKAIILPISGINDQGLIRGETPGQMIAVGPLLATLPETTIIITGSFNAAWRDVAARRRLVIYEYAEADEIAILNSIPTAEGALGLAMTHMAITIHHARVLVLGFGRVGQTVARLFAALNAKVTVAARRRDVLARAWAMGLATHWSESQSNLPSPAGWDLVINTIPAPVIDRVFLAGLPPEAMVIDLASPPGGTDFEAAAELNINAILAPGLPGKVAPKTAGALLATALPEILEKLLSNGGER